MCPLDDLDPDPGEGSFCLLTCSAGESCSDGEIAPPRRLCFRKAVGRRPRNQRRPRLTEAAIAAKGLLAPFFSEFRRTITHRAFGGHFGFDPQNIFHAESGEGYGEVSVY